MFCYKCGYEISDDSIFCSKCGTKQVSHAVTINSNIQTENKDLDREAIKIYLANVLALECFIQKLNSDFNIVNNEIIAFEDKNYIQRFQCSEHNYAWLRFDGEKYYVFFDADNKGNYYLGLNKDLYYECFGVECRYNGDWFPIDENWEYLNNQANYPDVFRSNSMMVELLVGVVANRLERKTNKDGFFEAYNKFISIAPEKYQENLQIIMPSMEKRAGIEEELEEAKALLEKSYSINVIPKQFRNIHAVWFIHDYILSSTESLSSAFLHCDLDKIKQKLDEIIEQQKEIIINQNIIRAQNAQMIEQNQQMLNRLASIEQNTERAAQYAEIASNNAEACAWISMANYIKN